MNDLEMYKNLSDEDKNNLTMYSIYHSIYIITENNDQTLSDDIVSEIGAKSYLLYLSDDAYNLSENQIADYLTQGYINDNDFLNKISSLREYDVLEAINEDNYDIVDDLDNEMEM